MKCKINHDMGVKVIFPELDSFIQDLTLKWDITASDRRR